MVYYRERDHNNKEVDGTVGTLSYDVNADKISSHNVWVCAVITIILTHIYIPCIRVQNNYYCLSPFLREDLHP